MSENKAPSSTATNVPQHSADVVTIKKYANRRLYNTATSSYVTLDTLASMVKEGVEFAVFDAKSGDDITRQVLTHIIVEEENKGTNLLPIGFLRHLISFYGDSLQSVVPNYLESSMQSFAKNQEQMRSYMSDTLGGINPFGAFDEMNKQNMAMFERTMRLFSPFPGAADGETDETDGAVPPASTKAPESSDDRLEDLQSKLEAMQKQLDGLSKPDK